MSRFGHRSIGFYGGLGWILFEFSADLLPGDASAFAWLKRLCTSLFLLPSFTSRLVLSLP